MAQKKQVAQATARKQELTAQLAAARQSISHTKQELVGRLNIKNLLGRLVSRKPKALFAGSTAAALILTLLLKRPKKSKKSSSPKTARQILFTWLLSLLKPAAKAWLVARAKKLASERISRPYQNAAHQQVAQQVVQDRGKLFMDV